MATFAVETLKLTSVYPHPNADALELAVVGPADVGFHVVVPKGRYKEGEVVAYIPEAAILPDWLIADLGLEGKLAGSAKNRVKCIRLRGEVSQGLVWVPTMGWDAWFRKYNPTLSMYFDEADAVLEGEVQFDYAGIDITKKLGITKYVPEIPSCMGGNVNNAPEWMKGTDSENIKKVGDSLVEGEPVVITEKIHGTALYAAFDGERFYVSSKGILARGCVLAESEGNAYWQAFHHCNLEAALRKLYAEFEKPVQLLGEAYGKVQDLKYGNPTGPLKFLAFDIRVGDRFLDANEFVPTCQEMGIPMVPLLYFGPYSVEKVRELTDGKESVSGQALHLREGVVIKPAQDRGARWGRVSIKSVSADYLTRKGETTEFE